MQVTFQFENGTAVQITCTPGENLLELARRADVAIDAPCSGNGSCGKCRVKLLEGRLETVPSRHISPEEFREGWRLSCGCRVLTDCVVLVPDAASAYRSRLKTADLTDPREVAIFQKTLGELRAGGINFANHFTCLDLRMKPPGPEDTLPDKDRFTAALLEEPWVRQVEIPFCVMEKLARVLRQNDFHVCAKGWREGDTFHCMEICPPEDTALVGCAVDIGTTTVTMALINLKTDVILAKGSAGNGQIRYGADVINRILEQGKPGGRQRLQKAIVQETLNPLLRKLCEAASVTPDSVLRLCVAANTTMNHLLLGVDAEPIRTEPYIPSFFSWDGLKAGDLGLAVNPRADVVLAPNIGSYVGGDITAGTLASAIWDRDEMSLLIDLGTNGEIVFGNREFLIACACSAGPAFEGGDISCGMRATDGAIEKASIDPVTMEPRFTVIGGAERKPLGICGSGIIDVIAGLHAAGIINAGGKFVREGNRVKHDAYGMGRFILAFGEESGTGREISLNEVDIDNFIRAKGAIYSGIDTLLQSVDMTPACIDRVYVAGGIGSGINMENAIRIGMFPDVEREKFRYIGNSALAGAYALTVSDMAIEKCREVAGNMTYLELSACLGYMDSFVAACFIPHTNRNLFPSV